MWKDWRRVFHKPVRHGQFWLACVRSRGWTGEPFSWKEAPSWRKEINYPFSVQRKHTKKGVLFIFTCKASRSWRLRPASSRSCQREEPSGWESHRGWTPMINVQNLHVQPRKRCLNLWVTAQKDSSGIRYECTLEFTTLPDRKDQDDTSSCAERCVQFLLIHWQCGPNTLKVTGKNMRLSHFTRFY